MRKLILGGSFNPIHHGHLACSRAVAEAGGFDRVTLMSDQPGPRISLSLPAWQMRCTALPCTGCRLQADALFEVDELELSRTGPSYTIDTVGELAALGENPIHWIIGADMLMYLPHWHRIDALLNQVNFIIMARPDCPMDWSQLPAKFQSLKSNVVAAP